LTVFVWGLGIAFEEIDVVCRNVDYCSGRNRQGAVCTTRYTLLHTMVEDCLEVEISHRYCDSWVRPEELTILVHITMVALGVRRL
jgi:hypothetical protein